MDQLLGLSEPWAYLLIAVLAAAEGSAFLGLFLPGEAAMLVGGFIAYQGNASIGVMIAVACVGAIVGDSLGYEIGKRLGPRLKTSWFGRKVGEQRWDKAAAYLRERGGRAVFFGRFIGVLRSLVPALAGSAGMPYRTFLRFNVAGGVVWATTFVTLGYVTGGSWKVVKQWAGRASLVLLVLIALAVATVLATRWVRSHTDDLARRWQRFLEHPRVRRLRDRYDTQLAFLARRLDPRELLGLRLTISLVLVIGASWAFGALLEDVIARNEAALADRPIATFMLTHRSDPVSAAAEVVANLGHPLAALAVMAALAVFAYKRRRPPASLLLIALSAVGLGLPYLVALLVHRSGPPAALVSQAASTFPSSHTTAIVLAGLTAATVLTHGRPVARRAWAFGTAAFLAAAVGVARLYLSAEWFTDASAGLALGASWFAVADSIALSTISARATRSSPT